MPIKCLVFPATGGVQAIDAAGNILPLVGPTGSLIPSGDNVDDIGSAALRWRSGYFGTSLVAPSLVAAASGTADLTLAAAGAGSVKSASPLVWTGFASFAPASTSRAAGSASIVLNLAAAQTLTAPGGVTQKGVQIAAPVFNATAPLGAAITLSIDGPPSGTAVSAKAFSLVVLSGRSLFNGDVAVDAGLDVSGTLSLSGLTPTVDAGANDLTLSSDASVNLTVGAGAVLRLGGGAAGVQMSAFGVPPVTRRVVPLGATTDQVITALQELGWFSQT